MLKSRLSPVEPPRSGPFDRKKSCAGRLSRSPFAGALLLLPLLLLLPAGQGCLSSFEDGPARVSFYTLHYQAMPLKGQALPVILEINSLISGPNCDQTKMIYQDQELMRQEYVYHRWRAKPGPLVTSFLRRDFQQSGLFHAVIPEESPTEPTHRLEGIVDEFLELDTEEGWYAAIEASLTLLDARSTDISKQVLLQRRYRIEEPAEARTPAAVARAMSRAVAELARQVAEDVHGALSEAL